jgi:uncharacterized protein (TIGR02145 family)
LKSLNIEIMKTTKLFLKMCSRTAVRLCYCGCLLLLFAACSKDNYPQDSDTPPHAASDKTWVIESADGSIKQTWSDAIQIPECNKEDYDGGNWDAPKADCRSYTHEGNTYYYYSWPYVVANLSLLCPSPWRVPTREHHEDLYKAFGGDGSVVYDCAHVENKFIHEWGGSYGGWCHANTSVIGAGWDAVYWTLTEAIEYSAGSLCFGACSYAPRCDTNKDYGIQVRCVQ